MATEKELDKLMAEQVDLVKLADLEYRYQMANYINCECAAYLSGNHDRVMPELVVLSLEKNVPIKEIVEGYVIELHNLHLNGRSLNDRSTNAK